MWRHCSAPAVPRVGALGPPETADAQLHFPEHTVFVVWHDTQERVHGIFATRAAAAEYLDRLMPATGLAIATVFPEDTDALFASPLTCLRAQVARHLPPPSAETVYDSGLERWLWGNTRTRKNLADYLDAVGDGDGPALDTAEELSIARRALKFAAARLRAGIVD